MGRSRGRTVGREWELERLDQLLTSLTDGTGGVCIVEGEPGIGKSHLVAELRDRAGSADVRTLVGYGEPVSSGRPLHLLAHLVERDQLAFKPARDRQRAGLASPLSDRHQLQEAVIASVEHTAAEPLVLVAEDVHWADDASLLTLIEIGRLPETLPILLVVTHRSHPQSASLELVLDALRRHPGHLEIVLEPLAADAAMDLAIATVDGVLVDPERLLALAGGNPFFVVELARSMDQAGGEAAMPIERIAHLHDLDPRTLELLSTAAVLGVRFDLSTLAAMLEHPIELVADHLRMAADARLVDLRSDVVGFRHDLIREALYGDLPVEVRSFKHRRAAAVILDQFGDPVGAADHLLLGATPGDVTAADVLAGVAESIVSVDPERALLLLERANEIDGTEQWTDDRARRTETRLRGLAAVGHLDDALAVGRQIVALGADAAGRHHLSEVLAGLAMIGNRPHEALTELARAVASTDDQGRQALLRAQTGLAMLAAGDIAGGLVAARRAAQDASAAGALAARSLALSVEGRLVTSDHGYRQGRSLGREAVAVAELDRTTESHHWLPWFFLGLTELDLDDLDAAERAVTEGRRASVAARTPWAEPLYTALASSAALRRGDVDDAGSLAQSAVSMSQSLGSTQALAWAHALAALVALASDDLDTAEAQVSAADEAAASGAILGVDLVGLARALVAEGHGEVGAAFEQLHGAWQVFAEIGVRSCQPVLAPDLARLAATTGRSEVATEVAETMDAAAERTGLAWLRACASRCAGIAANSAEQLREAVSIYRSTPRRLDLAATLRELAAIVPDEARELRAEADGVLAACGVGPVDAGCPPETRFGGTNGEWERLTVTEGAIVSLVCEGLTNSEIARRRGVSRRTVESHLAHVYRKLGVRTRSQLVLATIRQGGVGGVE